MAFALEQLSELPSPFYRVSIKALIFDDQNRILVLNTKDGNTELPGGGCEHGESLEDALQRELNEELGVRAEYISPIKFTFQSKGMHGWHIFRLVVEAVLENGKFQLGTEMQDARFVTKEEVSSLPYKDPADAMLNNCIDLIWSTEGVMNGRTK